MLIKYIIYLFILKTISILIFTREQHLLAVNSNYNRDMGQQKKMSK